MLSLYVAHVGAKALDAGTPLMAEVPHRLIS